MSATSPLWAVMSKAGFIHVGEVELFNTVLALIPAVSRLQDWLAPD